MKFLITIFICCIILINKPLKPTIQSTTQPSIEIQKLFDDLRSDNYQIREDATYALLKQPIETLPVVEKKLATETDTESVGRLKKIASHLFLKNKTPLTGNDGGMLGICWSTEPLNNNSKDTAIVIEYVLPGFPSYEVLKQGDRIIMIDNKPIVNYSCEDFVNNINSKAAGTLLPITIRRDGKEITVKVLLADSTWQNIDIKTYLKNLKTIEPKPLIIKDNTPTNINIQNIEELETDEDD